MAAPSSCRAATTPSSAPLAPATAASTTSPAIFLPPSLHHLHDISSHGRVPPPLASSSPSTSHHRYQKQKERTLESAGRLGWRIQKQDEALVEEFCAKVGVSRQLLKVRMHNNQSVSDQVARCCHPRSKARLWMYLISGRSQLGTADSNTGFFSRLLVATQLQIPSLSLSLRYTPEMGPQHHFGRGAGR